MAPALGQAIILAAGEATRLRPLTERRAKGMLLVGGQPILWHLGKMLKALHVTKLVLVVGHGAETIQSFFKDGKDFGLRIEYVHQTRPTGTADAARLALPHIDAKQSCLILPGDNYLTAATLEPTQQGTDDLLLLANPKHETNYGIPELKGDTLIGLHDGQVTPGSTRVSTGVLRATGAFLSHLAASKDHDLDRVIHSYVEGGAKVRTADVQGPWEDITEPWDVLQVNEHILRLDRGTPEKPVVGKTSKVASTAILIGPVTIGEGSTIGDYTVIGPYVSIRNNTTIGSHCEIRRSILNNNVSVDSRCLIRGSVLDDGVKLGAGFVSHESTTPRGLVGCVLGSDSEIGPDCRAESGALLPAESKVEAGGRIKKG